MIKRLLFTTLTVFIFLFLIISKNAFAQSLDDCVCEKFSTDGLMTCVPRLGTACPQGKEPVCQFNPDGGCNHKLFTSGSCLCKEPVPPTPTSAPAPPFEAVLPKNPVSKFNDVGSLVSAILPYVYGFAGLALFIMLIWGGITLMTAAGDPGKSKSGYGKISAGLIGFLIVFISYFVTQIVEVVLGIKIL